MAERKPVVLVGGQLLELPSGDTLPATPPTGSAGGVLSGSYPNPGFAVDMATQGELDTHTANTANPHGVTKAQVGLGNVDNISDANKPVSTATQTALDGKQPLDADLTAIAALTGTSGLLKKTAANTWELTESGGGGGSSNPPTLTYTYTGVMTVPPVSLPGTTEGLFAAPSGNERSYGVLLSSANYGLTGIEFTKLELVLGAFNPSTMAALTSLSLPALTTVGGNFGPSSMAALTSLSLPALTTVRSIFAPSSMAALTSLSLPVIERIGTTISSGNAIQLTNNTAALATFALPTTLKQVGGTAGNVTITSAALDQASVDSILVRLAALDGTGGTVAFSNRTVTITGTSATPSSTGLAAKATLVARGCTVTHN